MPVVSIKKGREKSILHRHPWIYAGSINRVEGSPEAGETVKIVDSRGGFLAWAAFSLTSQIRCRIWSWDQTEKIDRPFFESRLQKSLELRQKLRISEQNSAYRLVHGESDGIPGLIVDRYADTLVIQVLSAGSEFWRSTLIELLPDLTGINRIYERSDVDVRKLEGLAERTGQISGMFYDEPLIIRENGYQFYVDVKHGHKTGFYLDQRGNRSRLAHYAGGRQILNCFSYTGAFTVYALASGANSVLSIDSSAEALEMGRQNIILNSLDSDQAEWLQGDVFHKLRLFRDQGRSFDLIILDPPKFAPSVSQAERAARGYKDINLLAFKLLRPGGILFTFSCSGGISSDLFQKIVAGAALDAGVNAHIIERLSQGSDHPVALNFPEGSYLKGLVCITR